MKRALILLLILVLCLSFDYAAIESVHDCEGEADCPICKIIAVLSRLFITVEALFVWVAVCPLLPLRVLSLRGRESAPCTLTTLRVKLSF